MPKNKFRFDWVLVDELAIGTAPSLSSSISELKDNGIVSILSLCSNQEVELPDELNNKFLWKRVVLPDHTYGTLPDFADLMNAINVLEGFQNNLPTFVHCVAAMERSPLVCMAWLIRRHSLTVQQALDYMMQIHPGTNPISGQLDLLRNPLLLKR